ncbi:acetate uptake transporter [Sulfoacidibacillus thermotolerans]|uniref:Transcriptional regulator n=1 Tax=Sulfoacidibacillus thermotolerans TaxID=1765684 RepID=A0A2U3DB17_SULT2|nr:GPR1/FUN34/YaaH family transporter [Sulfoacidibacillus thermotolerans]PWI58470.1 transcriptional regulator [Sulfoacidibacillus thermotolerans]
MSEKKPDAIADPGPLGLAGFGLTTCVLSSINAGLLPGADIGVVLPLALTYGGTSQLLAGMWEFRKGNTFGATAFTSYGAFWIAFYLLVTHISSLGSATGAGVGMFLLMWGIFTLYMFIGTLYLNRALFLVFLFLTITFFLLAIANFSGSSPSIGGWTGLLTGILALYTSFAGIVNTNANRVVVPVGSSILKPR